MNDKIDKMIEKNIVEYKFNNWNGEQINLSEYDKNIVLFFVSLECYHCVEMLPEISKIIEKYSLEVILFSTGNNEDSKEMIEFFEWNFPIISLTAEEMSNYFDIGLLPSVLFLNKECYVDKKGVIYNINDFKFLYETL